MPRFDAPICVACGNEMTHLVRAGYRRCHECVTAERPASLALARHVRESRLRDLLLLHDDDPAGRAAA